MRRSIEWLPRYPVLIPLDFLYGHLKNDVNKTRPDKTEELKTWVRNECNNIFQENVNKVQG